ncbi:MAG: ComF family protein, partial [Wohlfahrtiimonas sp.]
TEQRFNYCHSCCGDVLSGSDCLPCQLNAHHYDIDHYIVGYRYHHAMRDAIIQLKFNHKMHMVRVVQELMNPVLEEHKDILAEVDYIVPMPVDRVRLAGRGFNHMQEIANALQASISRPILHDVLYKHAFSIPQSNLSKQERSSNLQGAFESNQVHGHILLLDDVITTGKTLQFASQCLKNAGAERITALVLAKA